MREEAAKMFFLSQNTGSGPQADCRSECVFICDECVDICMEIMEDEMEEDQNVMILTLTF